MRCGNSICALSLDVRRFTPDDRKKHEAERHFEVTINGKTVSVAEGDSVLSAALEAGFYIPHLCHHPRLEGNEPGSCRLCGVEVNGKMKPACKTRMEAGMEVVTDSPKVLDAVKSRLEDLVSCHPKDCMHCPVNGDCEFQDLVRKYEPNMTRELPPMPVLDEKGFDELGPYMDHSGKGLQLEFDHCVKCGRCVYMCNEVQGMHVLDWVGRGKDRRVGIASGVPLADTNCIECGQCSTVCPTGTLFERQEWRDVLRALEGGRKIVVAQTAPATRVAIGETAGMAPGDVSTGQMVAALRKLGFHYVFDTNFGADLTIMEEATELVGRLVAAWTGGKGVKGEAPALPMFTSCCPAWINFVEKEQPELIDNLSSCKSPQQMVGAVIKNVWAKKMGFKPEDVVMVSVMPCVAKKGEADRPEMITHDAHPEMFEHSHDHDHAHDHDHHHDHAEPHAHAAADAAASDGATGKVPQDVDFVITTRELGRMLDMKHIHLASLTPQAYDSPMGLTTGAAVIFGNTGGVMEAAVRTAYHMVTGKELESFNLTPVRGFEGVKEATLRLVNESAGIDKEVRIAVANGIGNARALVDGLKKGEDREFDFIEVMSCPGGCIGGGGQPKAQEREAAWLRMQGLYSIDERAVKRRSHENAEVLLAYQEEFKEPNSHRSHELLHTTYHPRPAVKYTPPPPAPKKGPKAKSA